MSWVAACLEYALVRLLSGFSRLSRDHEVLSGTFGRKANFALLCDPSQNRLDSAQDRFELLRIQRIGNDRLNLSPFAGLECLGFSRVLRYPDVL